MASMANIRLGGIIGCKNRPFLQLFTTFETEFNLGKSYLISQRSFGSSFLQIPAFNFNRKYSRSPLSLQQSQYKNVPASFLQQGNIFGHASWNENPLIKCYSNVPPHLDKKQKSASDKTAETNSHTKQDDDPAVELPPDVEPEKMGLVAKFKMMYKQYWYVLVPVHIVTSTGWMVGFYYLSQR